MEGFKAAGARMRMPTRCEIEAVCAICKCSLVLFSDVVPGHVLPGPWHFLVAPMSDRPCSECHALPCSRCPVPRAIRQHFNRVCAFAWKSLKLNASDGNLYASLCLRIRKTERGKRLECQWDQEGGRWLQRGERTCGLRVEWWVCRN